MVMGQGEWGPYPLWDSRNGAGEGTADAGGDFLGFGGKTGSCLLPPPLWFCLLSFVTRQL